MAQRVMISYWKFEKFVLKDLNDDQHSNLDDMKET